MLRPILGLRNDYFYPWKEFRKGPVPLSRNDAILVQHTFLFRQRYSYSRKEFRKGPVSLTRNDAILVQHQGTGPHRNSCLRLYTIVT